LKIICIIPARIGSVRIKYKNIIDFNGKSLVYWTLIQSRRIKEIKKTIISSDSTNLLKFSKRISKKIMVDLRPKKLSYSRSRTEDLIKYLIEKYKLLQKDAIMILQPTSPLRKDYDIKKIIKTFRINKLKTLNSVSIYNKKKKIKRTSYIYYGAKKKIDNSYKYSYNGAVYLFKVSYFCKTNKIYEKIPNIYLMDKKHSIDIDNYKDLKGYSDLSTNFNF
jgi:CMP-N,N'-diacetyllegionaminic acid synthase